MGRALAQMRVKGWIASQAADVRDPAAWNLAGAVWSRDALPGLADNGGRLSCDEAEAVCRRIASGHYENFSVVSLLVPRDLRQDFANVYAFARWSDDLADESLSPREASQALATWRRELDAAVAGQPRHPVMAALSLTIARHRLSLRPFHDLLDAFEQDQHVTRYRTRDELLDYCRRSANPVGRIVLELGGCRDPQRFAESDAICTGLQLVNFWQDIRRDRAAGRIYLPADDMDRHGVVEADLDYPQAGDRLRQLVAEEVTWASECFDAGSRLVRHAPRSLRPAIAAFLGGGRAVASAIRRAGFDTLARRPVVSRITKAGLLLRAAAGRAMCGVTRLVPSGERRSR